MSTKRLNIDILANDKTKQALTGVQGNLNKTRQSVLNLKNALIGLGVGAVLKSFVDVGKEVESLRTRFKFLFGSADEGAVAFDNLTKFASKVPFSLQEISRASGNLAVVAQDADDLNRILEITGNVAAVTGLDFETTASQIQRAFSGGIGAADLFRERGVRALLGFQNGAKVTAEETVARFEELFSGDGRFAKATEELAQTLEGTLSMLGDKYFKFQKEVADNFFDEFKKEFGDLNKFLEDNELAIESFAQDLGTVLADAIVIFGDAIKVVKDNSDLLLNVFKTLIGLKIAAFALGAAKGFLILASSILASASAAQVFNSRIGFGLGALVTRGVNFIDDLIASNEELAPSLLETANQIKNLFQDIGEFSDGLDRLNNNFISAEESAENFQKSLAEVNAALIARQGFKNLDEFLAKNKTTYEKIAEQTENFFKTDIQKLKDKQQEELKVIEKAQNDVLKKLDLIEKGKLKVTDRTHQSLIERQKELGTLLIAVEQKYQDQITEIQNTANEERKAEQLKIFEEIGEKFDEHFKKMNETMMEQRSIIEILQDKYSDFNKDFNANLEIANALTDAFVDLKKGIGDAVAQSVVFGKTFQETFGNVARQALASLISSLVQVGVQLLANQVIQMLGMQSAEKNTSNSMKKIQADALPTAFLVSLATGGRNAIGAIAGTLATFAVTSALGSRQNGGPVFAGQPYLVGEQGKEMFVPNQSGTIVSNRDMNQGTVVNVNIMANDTQGFDDLLVKRRSVIVNVINDALNSQGKEALV